MNFDNAKLLWTLPWETDWVSAVSFVGPKHIAAGNNLGELLLWELPEKPEPTPEPSEKEKKSNDKSERPMYVAPMPVRQFTGHTNVINRLLCAENRWLISASNDHTIRYWDLNGTTGAGAKIVLNSGAIEDAIRNKRSGRKPPAAMEVELKTQQAAKTIEGKEWIIGLSMTHDQAALIAGDDAGNVTIYDRVKGTEKKTWKVKGWAFAVALAPFQNLALVSERYPLVFDSGRHCAVKIWNVESGAVEHDLSKEYKDMQIAAAAFSHDGLTLAIGRGGETDNGKLFFIDPKTGKKLREGSAHHQYGVTDLCFHPGGEHIASSGRDTVVRITEVATGKVVKELGKPRGGQFKDWIHAISFSPDGKRLAAADMAGFVHVWEFAG